MRDIWKVNLPISQTSTISLAFEPPPPTAAWISIPSVVGYGYFQEVQKQLRISLFYICWKVWIVFKDFSNIIHHVDPLLYLPSWLPVLILFYLNEMRFFESYWKNCNHLERYMYVLQWGLHVGGGGGWGGEEGTVFSEALFIESTSQMHLQKLTLFFALFYALSHSHSAQTPLPPLPDQSHRKLPGVVGG